MKITKAGSISPARPWWVGATAKCPKCGMTAELEPADNPVEERWLGVIFSVAIKCPTPLCDAWARAVRASAVATR